MKSFTRKIWIAVFCAVCLFAAAYLLRQQLLVPLLKGVIAARAQDQLGLAVTVQNISGSFLTDLELEKITAVGQKTAGLPSLSLSIDQARLRFSALSLLHGMDSFLKSLRIELQGLSATMDFSGNDQPAPPDDQPQAAILPLPPALPQITVLDGDLTLIHDGLSSRLSKVAVHIEPDRARPGRLRLMLKTGAVFLDAADAASKPFSLELAGAVEGQNIIVEQLLMDGYPVLQKGVFTVADFEPDRFAIRGAAKSFNGTFVVEALFTAEQKTVRLSGRDLNLAEVRKIRAFSAFPLAGVISAEATLALDPATFSPKTAVLSLAMADGSVAGVTVSAFSFAAQTDFKHLTIDRLEALADRNRVQVDNLVLPIQLLRDHELRSLFMTAQGSFRIKAENIPALFALADYAPRFLPRDIPRHTLTLEGNMQNGTLLIRQGGLTFPSGAITLDKTRLTLPGLDQPWQQTSLRGACRFSIRSLGELHRFLPLPEIGGEVNATLQVNGTVAAPTGAIVVHGTHIVYRGTGLGTIDLAAAADGRMVSITSCTVKNNRDRLSLAGAVDLSEKTLKQTSLALAIDNLAHYRGLFPAPWRPEGKIDVELNVHGPLLNPEGRLTMNGAELRLADLLLPALAIKATNRGTLLDIRQLSGTVGQNSFFVTGEARHDLASRSMDLALKDLSIARQEKRMRLCQPARLRISQDTLTIPDVSLCGDLGEIAVSGRVSALQDLDLAIRTRQLNDGGLLDALPQAVNFSGADLRILLTGKIKAPDITASGTVDRFVFRDKSPPLAGVVDFDYRHAQGFRIRQCKWTATTGARIEIMGSIPFDPLAGQPYLPQGLDVTVSATIPSLKGLEKLLPDNARPDGAARASLRLTGSWEKPHGSASLEADAIDPQAVYDLLPPGPLSASVEVILSDNTLQLVTCRAQSPQFNLDAAGKWVGVPSLPRLFGPDHAPLSGQVQGRARIDTDDIRWIGAGIKEIRRTRGKFRADFTVRGDINDPDIQGSFALSEGELRLNQTLPPFENVFITARADKSMVRFTEIRGELGGAPFSGSGSLPLASETFPNPDFRLHGENLLLYRDEGLKIRADADLAVQGPAAALTISGDIALTDARYTRNVDFLKTLRQSFSGNTQEKFSLFSFHEPPLKNARLHVKITAKNPFVIKNNLSRAELNPDLLLHGTGELPVLSGAIYLDSGQLSLPAGRLYAESGLIRFPEDNPYRPQVDIMATSKMLGYDISLAIEGSMTEPVVTLSSSPPLPEEDLLFLVLAGRRPTTAGEEDLRRNNLKVTVYLAQELLLQWFGNGAAASEMDILDRFDIEIGRDITNTGDETIEVQYRLKSNLFKEGDRLYITSERDIYDEFNLGIKIVFRFR